MRQLAEYANNVADSLSELGYDHAGPLYHRILGSPKSDGAFYTNNVSALMLVRLALDENFVDWSDEDAVANLRIIDPAVCSCARGYIGRVDDANLVKLHTGEPMVSYLSYPDFESDPHPTLASSMTVHLQSFRVRERDYTTSQNPPILHRKETFVASDHPLHAKFARLTRQEESKGLYEAPSHIGTRRGWEELLAEKGFLLRGHRLIRRQNSH